jgi:hypothetical protein
MVLGTDWIHRGIFYGGYCSSQTLGKPAIARVTIFLSSHFEERYKERVGRAPPTGQRKWVEKSIEKNGIRNTTYGSYFTKLVGAPFWVYLVRIDEKTWVAKTVKPMIWKERRKERRKHGQAKK